MKRLSYVTAAALAAATLAACDKGPNPRTAADRKAGAAPEQTAQPAVDSELSNRVRHALTSADDVRIGGVGVAAADGVVTLYGTVDLPAEKDRAALRVMEIDGVRSVVNHLVVVRGS